MLARIIEWSLRNRFLVMLGLLVSILAGVWAIRDTRLDAIPDLSDVQVIVYTQFPGQGPRVVEDQVTYPITTKMLSVPHAKVVRGYSHFGFSFVYVLFEDGTDPYWARSRVLEYLSGLASELPPGVSPQLGPDATGVGWAFMYTLNSTNHSLEELRSIQDWYLKYALTGVEGVAEVASLGGYVRQYQVEVDPVKLRAYGVSLPQIKTAIQRSNKDVGGRLLEMGERELVVRGLGYIKDVRDLEQVSLGAGPGGTPALLRDVARVTIGPEIRRGIAEWNGEGETVGGIIVVRENANTLATIAAVKERLAELEPGLPEGVEISVAYDRTQLIHRSIDTLTHTLIEESIIVALVCAIFLFHLPSALVAIFSIPVSILIAFVVMRIQGLGANIMSLGGIAISIGVLVDAAIVMVENAHKHYEEWRDKRSHYEIILKSAQEVGPTLFFTLLVITVSFLAIFTLQEQEGRLFRPLAFTKTYALAASSVVAITVIPVLMYWFVRGNIHSEETHPVSKLLRRIYTPVLHAVLRFRWWVIAGALALMLATLFPLRHIGSEFMPPLWEGDLLYMPTTFPGISITKAKELLQQTDQIIAGFPEVRTVFGKIGRAETATDPAPLSMIETTIILKDRSEWRPGMTKEKLIRELDEAIQFPGLTNSWTMPIRTRIDMLSTGIKTPVGIKIAGPDLKTLEDLGQRVEGAVKGLDGTLSAYAERVMGGTFLDFDIDREAAARYGLTVGDVQDVIQSAIGGMNVGYTVEGLERYPINVRYPRELRDDLPALREILVTTPAGAQIPLGQLADLRIQQGPPMIKSENARPNAWVYVDLRGVDVGTWVREAKQVVADQVSLPPGYTIYWSGQYEYMERARQRLLMIVPLTLFLVILLLYINTKSVIKTALVLLAIPFSLVGAVWVLWALGYNWSIAVWVGLIALAGLDAETGVVMLLYLDLAYERWRGEGRMRNRSDLTEAVHHGAVQRIRPKLMTVATTFIALVPILWATGTGADVMRRIAAPMVGGIVTSFLGELVVYPALYFIWRSIGLRRSMPTPAPRPMP
ncbi:MAG: CusA/CzcA family heavy metal efflux RND transporter [Candidatus Eisenbacteria bacterium]|uniref:Efflux RND transporter permease subunit n=1 Tax=Eiseniibacteriota bacterium TaxID=2212470 RepID=A0A956LWM0_UNCEI|nr:efflux RND transporter permease subunit [Candidatus Eisenbacteria bacterium]